MRGWGGYQKSRWRSHESGVKPRPLAGDSPIQAFSLLFAKRNASFRREVNGHVEPAVPQSRPNGLPNLRQRQACLGTAGRYQLVPWPFSRFHVCPFPEPLPYRRRSREVGFSPRPGMDRQAPRAPARSRAQAAAHVRHDRSVQREPDEGEPPTTTPGSSGAESLLETKPLFRRIYPPSRAKKRLDLQRQDVAEKLRRAGQGKKNQALVLGRDQTESDARPAGPRSRRSAAAHSSLRAGLGQNSLDVARRSAAQHSPVNPKKPRVAWPWPGPHRSIRPDAN